MSSEVKMSRKEAGRLGWEASKESQKRYWEEFRRKYEESPDACQNCRGVLPYEKRGRKFCSSSCGASYNNRLFPKRQAHCNKISCRLCGKQVVSRRKQVVFCSQSCQAAERRAESARKIENGEFVVASPSITLRRYLYDKRGKTCEVCRLSKWMDKPIPLNVQHLDGDATNNRPENLQLICLNCHGQTETFANLGGRKGTRSYRRKV